MPEKPLDCFGHPFRAGGGLTEVVFVPAGVRFVKIIRPDPAVLDELPEGTLRDADGATADLDGDEGSRHDEIVNVPLGAAQNLCDGLDRDESVFEGFHRNVPLAGHPVGADDLSFASPW